MPSIVVALFLAVGIAAWVYSKITRRTGGIAKSDLTVTVIVAVFVFFVSWTLLNMIPQ